MPLLTIFEVYKYAPVGKDYPSFRLSQQIPIAEQKFVRDYAGQDFWDYLTANLIVYEDAPEWVCEGHDEGEMVTYMGAVYESLEDDNASTPSENNGSWQLLPRFDVACIETVWDGYIAPYLALMVYKRSLPYAGTLSHAGGVTVYDNVNKEQSAKGKDLSGVAESLENDAAAIIGNMVYWMDEGGGKNCVWPSGGLCGGLYFALKTTSRFYFR